MSCSFTVIPGAGRTKGFWHNDNGKDLLALCDPAWRVALNDLCLRRPDGSVFLVPTGTDFDTAFDALSNFLVGEGVHGEAANQLSTQLAATVLNNLCGFMQGVIYVDVAGDGVLISLESLIEGARTLLCDDNANDTGPDTAFPTLRTTILNCLNEYNNINETGDLNNPQIVYGVSEGPEEFVSPYGDEFEL